MVGANINVLLIYIDSTCRMDILLAEAQIRYKAEAQIRHKLGTLDLLGAFFWGRVAQRRYNAGLGCARVQLRDKVFLTLSFRAALHLLFH